MDCITASQRLYGLRQLCTVIAGEQERWHLFNMFVRPILCYGFPAFCTLGFTQFARLEKIERRAAKIIGTPPSVSLRNYCNHLCTTLASSTRTSGHRLAKLATTALPLRTSRHARSLAPFARTKRFKNSFIMYL